MTFTTATFVLFLIATFSLHWSFRGDRARNVVLLVASYVFYSWWDWRFSGLMLAASLMDYGAGIAMVRVGASPWRKRILILSMIGNLGMLGVFKYFNFFAQNLHALARAIGFELDPVTLDVVLPAGISFYTFQTMSYTLEIYRGQLKPTRDLLGYLTFVSFFPHLVAGPIMRAHDLLPQLQAHRTFDLEAARDGLRQMLWGFFKKVALADSLSVIVDLHYGEPGRSSGMQLAFATFAFAFQIYCDFSAYSDLACGTARLFGVRLIRNFAYPYFSQSIQEFWRRWHISLSTWFRDYLFIPLGGSRGGENRTARNAMVTFLLSGFWHGASWNFLLWGAIHGAAVAPTVTRGEARRITRTDTPGGERDLPDLGTLARIAGTFTVTCLGWVFFRARTLGDASLVLTRMATGLFDRLGWRMLAREAGQHALPLVVLAAFVLVEWLARRHEHPLRAIVHWPRAARWAGYTLLIWGSLFLAPHVPGHFIYFAF